MAEPADRTTPDGPGGRGDPRRGYPDLNDPLAGIGGAAPAHSALTFRLVLAVFGLVFSIGAAVLGFVAGLPVLGWVLVVVAVVALVDIGRIVQRKMRGEPG